MYNKHNLNRSTAALKMNWSNLQCDAQIYLGAWVAAHDILRGLKGRITDDYLYKLTVALYFYRAGRTENNGHKIYEGPFQYRRASAFLLKNPNSGGLRAVRDSITGGGVDLVILVLLQMYVDKGTIERFRWCGVCCWNGECERCHWVVAGRHVLNGSSGDVQSNNFKKWKGVEERGEAWEGLLQTDWKYLQHRERDVKDERHDSFVGGQVCGRAHDWGGLLSAPAASWEFWVEIIYNTGDDGTLWAS